MPVLITCAICANAALAQLVEHIIRNDGVGCSNHPSGTTGVFFYDFTILAGHIKMAATSVLGAAICKGM